MELSRKYNADDQRPSPVPGSLQPRLAGGDDGAWPHDDYDHGRLHLDGTADDASPLPDSRQVLASAPAIPEPSSDLMMAAGLLLIGGRWWWRRRAATARLA